jgi:hypothetical protein
MILELDSSYNMNNMVMPNTKQLRAAIMLLTAHGRQDGLGNLQYLQTMRVQHLGLGRYILKDQQYLPRCKLQRHRPF